MTMTIRDTLTEIYPDLQFMGTRRLGTKYVLSRGMRGYFVSNRLTGKIVCTWDTNGILYATTDGLSPYEKRLITMILKIWRNTPRIQWETWDRYAQRINDRWGHQYVLVSVP